MNDQRLLYRVDEVAELTSTSRAHIYRAIRDGTLPSILLGTARRVRRDDLLSYLDSLPRRAREVVGASSE